MELEQLKVITILLLVMPLLTAVIHYQFGKILNRTFINAITISLLSITFGLTSYMLYGFIFKHWQTVDITLYVWGTIANKTIQFGLLVDLLSTLLLAIISCIALMVHIYSIYYMQHEENYTRFFSYIAFFTFAMLVLVVANNFLQLFFAWEMVGLASYLLIGFWFTNETAVRAGFKAFLINRISDFGLFLGILVIFSCYQTFNYSEIFVQVTQTAMLQAIPMNLICVLLLIGALGKSAQMPFHTWLPDSMAGPLPVSVLIHAATMVTAGVFMIARVMPLMAYSVVALHLMLWIGIITCIAMGLVALVQYDVKQILAYSTISQLGLMLVALGSSATTAAIAHLVSHAFFKALLFLGVGVVIVVYANQQDLRKMGGLRLQIPLLYYAILSASLAAIGMPGLTGFYSKELILAAIHNMNIYYLLLFSIFITSLYTMRMFFLIFYGQPNTNIINSKVITKSWLINLPLVILAIPVLALGWFDEGAWHKILFGFASWSFLLLITGVIIAWFCYGQQSVLTIILAKAFIPIHFVLVNKYWFEKLNEVIVSFGKLLGKFCFQVLDKFFIENVIIHGGVICIQKFSNVIRRMQTGYLYHYMLIMLFGLILLLYVLVGNYGGIKP